MRHRISLFAALIAFSGLQEIAFANSPQLLSAAGSDRATAYVESTKLIRSGDRLHISWLERVGDGFFVRIQSVDTESGLRSPIYTVGEAEDNHGGPALTIDEDGYLHVLYYPHHSPMHYRRSARTNDASEWTAPESFGDDLTYPALLCAADGTLIMAARRSFDDRPWELELWRKPPAEPWTRIGPVLRARYGNYAQFAASLAWGSDHATLHLATRIYEIGEWDGNEEPSTTIGYLRSVDGGKTWTKADGSPVQVPANAEMVDRIASNVIGEGRVYAIGSMAVGPDDRPFIPYGFRRGGSGEAYLASPDALGTWSRKRLNSYLSGDYKDWDLAIYGGASFGSAGQLLVAVTAMPMEAGNRGWADLRMEVLLFQSADGGRSFLQQGILAPDPTQPRWLPNVERPTGFNEMPLVPDLIFTEGANQDGGNRVLWWETR